MMLTSIQLRAFSDIATFGSDYQIELFLRGPSLIAESSFFVKSITGLDAEGIVAKTHLLDKREIAIQIGLNPTYQTGDNGSYSAMRDTLYKMIAASRTGEIYVVLMNGDQAVAYTTGQVSKLETDHFAKNPEAKLTITCDDTMFKGYFSIVLTPEEDPDHLVFIDAANLKINDANSTAPHGFAFEMDIIANIPDLEFSSPDSPGLWNFKITPSGGFLAGDKLHFSSNKDKQLYIERLSENIPLADVVNLGFKWPMLFPGINTFIVTHPTNVSWVSITYEELYWGV